MGTLCMVGCFPPLGGPRYQTSRKVQRSPSPWRGGKSLQNSGHADPKVQDLPKSHPVPRADVFRTKNQVNMRNTKYGMSRMCFFEIRYAYRGSVRPALLPKTLLQRFIRWFVSCGIFLGEIPLNPGVKNFLNNSYTPEFFGQFGGSDPKPLCS